MAKSKVKNRILFLSGQWADMGGLNKMIVTISALIASEYDVTICSLDICGPNDGYPIPEGVKYIELPPSALYELEKIINDLNIDVFVGSNNCDIPYLNLYKKLSEIKIKTVMWNHESFFLPYTQKPLYGIANYRKEIYKYPNAIVWLTETSATACRQYSEKVVVIGNCIEAIHESNAQMTAHNSQRLKVISLGRFDSQQKGIGYLLMMFSELLNINSNAALTVVGKYDMSMAYSDNTNETVGQLLRRLNIPKENIIFTGQVANPGKLIEESSFNVMVSEAEGFGLTVLEAATYGVPSVVFSGGGQEDVIQDGVSGIVVPYGDYSLMAKVIADNLKIK
jgi:glycosyltransferase involved in cell wall biosynthesis